MSYGNPSSSSRREAHLRYSRKNGWKPIKDLYMRYDIIDAGMTIYNELCDKETMR